MCLFPLALIPENVWDFLTRTLYHAYDIFLYSQYLKFVISLSVNHPINWDNIRVRV